MKYRDTNGLAAFVGLWSVPFCPTLIGCSLYLVPPIQFRRDQQSFCVPDGNLLPVSIEANTRRYRPSKGSLLLRFRYARHPDRLLRLAGGRSRSEKESIWR